MVSDRAVTRSGQVIFGPFRLIPAQKLLLHGEKPVRLGSRACEILIALVERAGQLLSNQELINRVWPNTFVEEGNLRVHMAALRRALGDGQAGNRYITNTPGRGYSFVAPVSFREDPTENLVIPQAAERHPEMPAPLARIVGRSDIVPALGVQLQQHRFVTIVGPGGIGKTTVAVAVAENLLDSFQDGVRFVDLAPLSDPLLVPSTLAAQLGVVVRSDNPLPTLIAFLREKRLLVVLDSCEHLIEAAASVAEAIFNGTKGTHILATSREILRAEGERVHRLSPLTFPINTAGLKAADALDFSSVQLFVERAAASLGSFELSDAEAPLVAEICRSLDGIALAIEIVASRVDAFGVAGLAARLKDRFQLLMQGRRTALPRHRTLGATLDWSYAQLPEPERIVLRRLASFAGIFTMESAAAILAAADTPAPAIVDAIANLIAKSLVSADVGGAIAFYRLLDTTRAYAFAKLDEADERDQLARLHAAHYRTLLEQAQADWATRPATEWLERHRHLIDNVRAALDWSFSPAGDPVTGVALTVAAIPLWFVLSLTSECAERVDRALAAPAPSRNADHEMRLYAARAWSLMQTRGSVPETQAAWTRVLEISEQQGDIDYQLRALWGLWAGLLNRGELRSALMLAERFSELAARQADTTDLLIGDRMIGYILHLIGDQKQAREYIERMLSRYEVPVIGAQIIRFVFDQRATAQCFLARILWLQGFADRSMQLAKGIVDSALANNDMLSVCQALVQAACPVALFVGDLEAVERYVAMLLDYSARQGLDFWQAFGHCFQGVLLIKRGHVGDGLTRLGNALEELREIQFGVYYGVFLSEFADALGRVGRAGEGLVAIDEALARSERNEERWYLAELLRIKGELMLRHSAPDGSRQAERYLLESLEWSRQQHILSWELRTSISLAALWRDQNRTGDAQNLITPLYARFAEGFGAADLRAAKQLMKELGGGEGERQGDV
jgi:predicted ATPase/DNA-binding winged helix-turn-helix (wHTH) protein